MNRMLLTLLCLSILLAVTSATHALSPDQEVQREITQSYRKGEYRKVLDLLQKRIDAPTAADKTAAGNGAQQYRDLLFSAYLRAWRLDDTDGALADLNRASARRAGVRSGQGMPPVELLFAGELYQRRGDVQAAEKKYRELLVVLGRFAAIDQDGDSRLILDELARLVRYQIDGLHPSSSRKERLLMPVFPAVDAVSAVAVTYLALLVSPTAQYEAPGDGGPDPVRVIAGSTGDIGSMVLNFALVADAPAGGDGSPREKAAAAYLAKYGDGYCGLMLRLLLIRNFRENGEEAKASAMTEAVRRIAAGRGMEVVLGPVQENIREPSRSDLMEGGRDRGGTVVGPYSGRVVDEVSGEPIEGTTVVVGWDKVTPTPAGGSGEFVDSAMAVTNRKGEYRIEGRSARIGLISRIDSVFLIVWQPGYTGFGQAYNDDGKNRETRVVRLRRLTPATGFGNGREGIEDAVRHLEPSLPDEALPVDRKLEILLRGMPERELLRGRIEWEELIGREGR